MTSLHTKRVNGVFSPPTLACEGWAGTSTVAARKQKAFTLFKGDNALRVLVCALGGGAGGRRRVSVIVLIRETHFQLSIIRLMWRWRSTKPKRNPLPIPERMN